MLAWWEGGEETQWGSLGEELRLTGRMAGQRSWVLSEAVTGYLSDGKTAWAARPQPCGDKSAMSLESKVLLQNGIREDILNVRGRITDPGVWGKKRKRDASGYLTLPPPRGFFLQPQKGNQKTTKHLLAVLTDGSWPSVGYRDIKRFRATSAEISQLTKGSGLGTQWTCPKPKGPGL